MQIFQRFTTAKVLIFLITIVSFVFGFFSSMLASQKNVTQYNNTPIRLYNQSVKVVVDKECPVKGKVSGTKKTYHLAGDQWYGKLNPTDCFSTEAEAKAAGFIKAKSLTP